MRLLSNIAVTLSIAFGAGDAVAHPHSACKVNEFRPFSSKVWDLSRWERGSPKRSTLEAAGARLACASGGHRVAMRKTWQRDRKAYGRYRALRLIAPYPGGGTWWAIPYYIVYCESGTSGLWSAYNPSGAAGAYQIMAEHDRPFPVTSWADKMAHHRIAAALYAGGAGAGNWVCA